MNRSGSVSGPRRGRGLALLIASHLLAAVGGALAAGWLLQGGEVLTAEPSPNGAYRLVVRDASRWQSLLNGDLEDPAVVELYRVHDGALLCRSGVTDAYLATRTWTPRQVLVGAEEVFAPFSPDPGANCRAAAAAQDLSVMVNAPPAVFADERDASGG